MAGNSGRPEAGSLSLGASSSSAERKRCRVISEQARGGEGDGCQDRISMTKGRWDAFSSLLLPRRGEGPPPLNSNAMGVCYANIPICC